MSAGRKPGTICLHRHAKVPDAQTSNRQLTPMPSVLGLWEGLEAWLVDMETHAMVLLKQHGVRKIYVNGKYAATKISVGDGYCVPLVQQVTGAPNTTLWVRGSELKGRPQLEPGTAIATFDSNGKYPNHSKGNHAAIFVGYTEHGVRIYDQYREWADSKYGKDWQKIRTGEAEALYKARIAAVEREYPEIDAKHGRFRRKQPGERLIRFEASSGSPSNDASRFAVIE